MQHAGVSSGPRAVNSGPRAVNRGPWGVLWSGEDARGPQHRLQIANQGVQYVKEVHGLSSDHRLPTTAMFKTPRTRLRVSQAGSGTNPGLQD
eukprot:175233-Prorocentrum_minimum.AAC.2